MVCPGVLPPALRLPAAPPLPAMLFNAGRAKAGFQVLDGK